MVEDLSPEEIAWFEDQVTSLQRLNDDQADDGVAAPAGTPLMFVDIDDVLCLSDPFGGYDAVDAIRARQPRPELVFRHLFHKPAVAVLRAVHEELAGRVRYVVTSTWRLHLNRSQMAEILRRSGLEFVANGLERQGRWCTVSWPNRTRLNEIAAWIDPATE